MSVKDEVIRSVVAEIAGDFGGQELRRIESAFYLQMADYDIIHKSEQCKALTAYTSPDLRAYQMFFVAKKVEGLSEKSLKVYQQTYRQFFNVIQKPLLAITTNDIRFYLATRTDVKPTTIDNERRHLSSLFKWLAEEEYIPKNPILKIKKIKQARIARKPFSQLEVEELRDACQTARDRAIIEILLSTGMRVGELHQLNRSDIDFYSSEVVVTGKGNKQRVCYLNAAAQKRIKDYLDTRDDDYQALIAAEKNGTGNTKRNSYRVGIGRIEQVVREIGHDAGVDNTHPHRFRRTAATLALRRGMPIEQVQIMLGHENIDTTLRYAITADEAVKHSHVRYM